MIQIRIVYKSAYNLLSRSTSFALEVVQFADGVATQASVFGATGLMQTSPITIELAANAVPAAVTTARGVPLVTIPRRHHSNAYRADGPVCSDGAGQGGPLRP